MKDHEIFCTKNGGGGLARYDTVLQSCVSLMTTSTIHSFPVFNRILLKLSPTCSSHFSIVIKTKLISGLTSPLTEVSDDSMKMLHMSRLPPHFWAIMF